MKRLALIALLGCTRSSEVKTEAKTDLRAEENVTQTVQTGPETITTTTEEYAIPNLAATEVSRDGDSQILTRRRSAPRDGGAKTVPTLLVKRTVVVDQRGPVIDTTVAAATTTVATDSHSDATKASSVGLSWKFYAAGVLVVLLLAGAAYVLWRAKMFML